MNNSPFHIKLEAEITSASNISAEKKCQSEALPHNQSRWWKDKVFSLINSFFFWRQASKNYFRKNYFLLWHFSRFFVKWQHRVPFNATFFKFQYWCSIYCHKFFQLCNSYYVDWWLIYYLQWNTQSPKSLNQQATYAKNEIGETSSVEESTFLSEQITVHGVEK